MMFFLFGASLRDAGGFLCFVLPNVTSLRDADGLLLLFLPSYAFFGMLVFCFLPTKHSCGMQAVSFMFVTKHCILWDESFSRRENRLVEKCGYVSITSLRDVP
jgi:hypothetical protein